MKYYDSIKKSYELTEKDQQNIASVKEMMEQFRDDFAIEVFETFNARFKLPDTVYPAVMSKHGEFLTTWYDKFFEAKISNSYIAYLEKFAQMPKKYSIEYEWVNATLSFIRSWIHEKIFQNIENESERTSILLSIHKFIDINIDVINYTFYENKLKEYTSLFSIKNFVVRVAEQFSFLIHTLLVLILIGMTVAAVILFGTDIAGVIGEGANKILISALGSLLIIWVIVELLHTEIQMLKGGKFKISIFVGVALIAFIRDLLIITLKHETSSPSTYSFVLVSIGILGLIYWFIAKTEK